MAKLKGREALRHWRKLKNLSQAAVGQMVVPPVKASAVTRWEDESDQRPDVATAIQLERVTGGEVLATAWGYSEEHLTAVRGPTPAAGVAA